MIVNITIGQYSLKNGEATFKYYKLLIFKVQIVSGRAELTSEVLSDLYFYYWLIF